MRILFIEDEPELNALGVVQVEKLGHQVVPTHSLDEARSILNTHYQTINAIIADHRLPDGWGVDFILDIQRRYPKISTCIVSGCLTVADQRVLKKAGIPYFSKPLIYSNVIKHLRQSRVPMSAAPVMATAGADGSLPKPLGPPSRGFETGTPDDLPPPPPPDGKPVEIARPTLSRKRGLTSIIFGKK